ncbi:hypothetical protein LAJ19_16275 (plasmid) [Deinococcus taeanensis]|nr:hypothetical protein [Deinococcus taeanensis]UBV44713.1 hypothetical protein LAJ19_16275 [Deinococcus taeanensis]
MRIIDLLAQAEAFDALTQGLTDDARLLLLREAGRLEEVPTPGPPGT